MTPASKDTLPDGLTEVVLIDLGTACGKVPLSMRDAGMLSVGLEGSDKGRKADIGCWKLNPDIRFEPSQTHMRIFSSICLLRTSKTMSYQRI